MKAAKNAKVGRPRSGKKQYLIRMTPTGHTALIRKAKTAGFSSLGDWLDCLEQAQSGREANLTRMSQAELSATLFIACNRAADALRAVHEVVDREPQPGKRSLAAFDALRSRYKELMKLASNVGVVIR